MIRVLFVDDHAAFRQPLAFMLNREADLEVVGQAGTLEEACTMLEGVDVAVMDLDMPDGNGVALVRPLLNVNPHGKVLILTASANKKQEAEAVEAGASGVINKSADIREIVDAIKQPSEGGEIMTLAQTVELLRLASRHREEDREAREAIRRLIRREREVLHEPPSTRGLRFPSVLAAQTSRSNRRVLPAAEQGCRRV